MGGHRWRNLFSRRVRSICLGFLLLAVPGQALADFERWSAEVEDDPFTGGVRVTLSYMETLRSGVFMFCDSTESGFRVRVIPGYAYTPMLDGLRPMMEFAIDGSMLMAEKGTTGSVGDNLAAAEARITGPDADAYVKAFMAAKRQVAIKDGMSDRPALLRASGSTKAGQALAACLTRQK